MWMMILSYVNSLATEKSEPTGVCKVKLLISCHFESQIVWKCALFSALLSSTALAEKICSFQLPLFWASITQMNLCWKKVESLSIPWSCFDCIICVLTTVVFVTWLPIIFNFVVSDNKAELKAALWRIPLLDETEPPSPSLHGGPGHTRSLHKLCDLENSGESMRRLLWNFG